MRSTRQQHIGAWAEPAARRRARRPAARFAGWGLGLALTIGAGALSPAVPSALAQSGGVIAAERPEDLAARALSRAALQDLKLRRAPESGDYRLAAELLEIAHAMAPREQIILRLLIEAQTGAGADDRVLKHTRTLVGIDPADTVAQLRLITGRISALQTTDERLAAYARFLSAEGEGIDPSIRSRLALDAALLLRERGDIDAFADRLSKAIELDPTNKDAASLAYTFYASRGGDAQGRLDLLLGVLYSDPFDPSVYQAVARELASAGAFAGADRFLRLLDRLYAPLGVQPNADEQTFREVVQWNLLGSEAIGRRITDRLDDARKDLLRRRQSQNSSVRAGPIEELPPIEDVRLPLASERTRLLAASAGENAERAANAMSELAETSRRMAETLADAQKRPKDIPESEVTPRVHAILAEVVWLRLWTNQQLEEAATGLGVLKKDTGADAGELARLEAWLTLRRGEADAARAQLEPLAATDPLCRLGLAVLAERTGDKRSAVTMYLELAQQYSGELLGAYSRTRIGVLSGGDVPRSEVARQLDETVSAVPDWLETILDNPARVAQLEVEPERSDVRVMERTPLRIRLTNLTPVPLGLGPDRPISSRFLLVPTVEVQGVPMAGGELIEVASLERRLRINPREKFEASVWGDAASLGMLLDMSSSGPSRVRWRVLQGFRFTAERVYERGPHSVGTDTAPLSRRPNARFLGDAQALKTSVETGGPREIGEALLAMRARQARTVEFMPLQVTEIEAIMDALAERFASMDKPVKLMVLALLPGPMLQPESRRVDAAVFNETDPDLLAAAMILRVAEPRNPVLALPNVKADQRLSALASIVEARLLEGAPMLATQTADVTPAVPPMVGPPRPESVDVPPKP